MICQKCRDFFPPGYVEKDLCIFCERDKNIILYAGGSKTVSREEIAKEYRIYLSILKERVELISEMPKEMDDTIINDIRSTAV